jgi:hypothetical protein
MCHVVGTSKIIIPDNVGSINSLQLYDTVASQAHDGSNGSPGQAYPPIVEAGGKIQIGTGAYTGVITSLLGDWKIVTAKTSGSFTVTDIYIKGSSTEPFDRIVGVAYSWEKTVNPTLQTISTGSGLSATQESWLAALYATLQSPQAAGVFSTAALTNAPSGGATPAQIWSYATRSLTTAGNQAVASEVWASQTNTFTTLGTVGQLIAQMGTQIDDTFTLYGFKPGSPLTATTTQHTAGGKRLLVSVDEPSGTTTITRDDGTISGDSNTAIFTMFF